MAVLEGIVSAISFCRRLKVTGSFETAVEEMGKVLFIQGKVIPVTTPGASEMVLNNRKLLEGEKEVYLSQQIDQGYTSVYSGLPKQTLMRLLRL